MPHAAPQGLFETRNIDERLAISVTTEAAWKGLCQLLNAEDWRLSEALSTHQGRYAAHDELCARVSAWARTKSRTEALLALREAGIPASAAINNHGLWPNDQLAARHFFQTMKHPHTGETRYPSFPTAFSALERELHRSPPPTLGQHNREILQGELGLRNDEYDRLEAEGIIGSRPSNM